MAVHPMLRPFTFDRGCRAEPNMSRRFAGTLPTGGTAIDAAGNIYVSDTDRERVIKITPVGKVSTLIQDPRLLWVRRDVDRQHR
jgi:hypothetical protein